MFIPAREGAFEGRFHSTDLSVKAELLSMQARLGQIITSFETSARHTPDGRKTVSEADVRRFIAWRAKRAQVLNTDLFADPAWDMLLELYASHLGQQRVSVTALCLTAGVPATTALRWVKVLERHGFAFRTEDPLDGRRHFVALSESGLAKMSAFFNDQPLPAVAFASAA